jgi:hypothetical protein
MKLKLWRNSHADLATTAEIKKGKCFKCDEITTLSNLPGLGEVFVCADHWYDHHNNYRRKEGKMKY